MGTFSQNKVVKSFLIETLKFFALQFTCFESLNRRTAKENHRTVLGWRPQDGRSTKGVSFVWKRRRRRRRRRRRWEKNRKIFTTECRVVWLRFDAQLLICFHAWWGGHCQPDRKLPIKLPEVMTRPSWILHTQKKHKLAFIITYYYFVYNCALRTSRSPSLRHSSLRFSPERRLPLAHRRGPK